MGDDRRRHTRIATHHLTTVFPRGDAVGGSEEITGRTLDLSEGGVLLEIAGELAEGLRVLVSVAVEDRLLEIEGLVLRSRPVGAGFFETAISFGPVDEATRSLIGAIRSRLVGPPA